MLLGIGLLYFLWFLGTAEFVSSLRGGGPPLRIPLFILHPFLLFAPMVAFFLSIVLSVIATVSLRKKGFQAISATILAISILSSLVLTLPLINQIRNVLPPPQYDFVMPAQAPL